MDISTLTSKQKRMLQVCSEVWFYHCFTEDWYRHKSIESQKEEFENKLKRDMISWEYIEDVYIASRIR